MPTFLVLLITCLPLTWIPQFIETYSPRLKLQNILSRDTKYVCYPHNVFHVMLDLINRNNPITVTKKRRTIC